MVEINVCFFYDVGPTVSWATGSLGDNLGATAGADVFVALWFWQVSDDLWGWGTLQAR